MAGSPFCVVLAYDATDGEFPAVRWGNQFRFFREEVLAVLLNRWAGPDEEEAD